MFFKLLIIVCLLFQSNTIVVDKIAAVVDEHIITITDIDKAILFFPIFQRKEESSEEVYQRVLQDLINYRVVSLEYKEDFQLVADDFEEVQLPIIQKAGSLAELYNLLARFDMDWDDFQNFITDKVVYEKVLKEKFQLEIDVGFNEIEIFYKEVYLPQQKRLNLEAKTLVEMTEVIEQYIQKMKIEKRLSGWLQEIRSFHFIDNKLMEE